MKIYLSLLAIFFSSIYFPSTAFAESILKIDPKLNMISFEHTLNKEISDWDARLEHARLLSYLKDYEGSLKEYNKLLELDPTSVVARAEMANVLYYQQKYSEALEIIEKIPIKDQDNNTRLLSAEIYLARKDYINSEKILRALLQTSPDDLMVKFKLAELLSWQKKYNESIMLYKQILLQKPNDIQVRRKYARVLMWMGKMSEAAKEMKSTLPENTNDSPEIKKAN